MDTLKVSEKNQLGFLYYRPECEKSQIFCAMLNVPLLNMKHISFLKRLGYKIEVVSRTPTEL